MSSSNFELNISIYDLQRSCNENFSHSEFSARHSNISHDVIRKKQDVNKQSIKFSQHIYNNYSLTVSNDIPADE